jgi:hypothetical protein
MLQAFYGAPVLLPKKRLSKNNRRGGMTESEKAWVVSLYTMAESFAFCLSGQMSEEAYSKVNGRLALYRDAIMESETT